MITYKNYFNFKNSIISDVKEMLEKNNYKKISDSLLDDRDYSNLRVYINTSWKHFKSDNKIDEKQEIPEYLMNVIFYEIIPIIIPGIGYLSYLYNKSEKQHKKWQKEQILKERKERSIKQ